MTASVRATVVIPTHDHGPMLVHSVGSALAQTVEDLEIFVVGDGAPDDTRDLMADLCQQDKRVRFFDNPKGPGHGELHRHSALGEARGRIVGYLCDDELWLPHHLETMENALRDAEFANTLAASIQPDDAVSSHVGDLGIQILRDHMLAGANFVPLSCGGHLLSAYRQLPHGWRTAPDGIRSELYMWQQFLGRPSFRFRTVGEITAVRFPSGLRSAWSPDERLAELETWALRLGDPGLAGELARQSATFFRQEATRNLAGEIEARRAQARSEEALAQLRVECSGATQGLGAEIRKVGEALEGHQRHIEHLEHRLAELTTAADDAAAVRQELARTRATVTWRLRERLVAFDALRWTVSTGRRLKQLARRAI